MNKKIRILSNFLIFLILLGVIFFSVITNKQNSVEPISELISEKIQDINIAPGSDESELNFAWYSTEDTGKATVLLVNRGSKTSDEISMEEAIAFYGTTEEISSSKYTNMVTINGLEENTEYIYKVGNGLEWSASFSFKTGNKDNFSFFFMGDPQIGASNLEKDADSWSETLNKAFSMFPDANMIFSAGDQANLALETEYSAFLRPELLRNIPLATTAGNHDELGIYNKYRFNNPNTSTVHGVSQSGSDYYFTYNDILFLVINTNNTDSDSHGEFLRNTVNDNPNVKWKVVVGHHSIYSPSNHSEESDTLDRRKTLAPIFEELGIDVVLMGHDHTYARTYQILGDVPQKEQNTDETGDTVYNPTGIVYITANSSTGSKYYALNETPEVYSKVRSELNVPTFLRINVTDDRFEIVGYRVDNGEEFDSYTIIKNHTKN